MRTNEIEKVERAEGREGLPQARCACAGERASEEEEAPFFRECPPTNKMNGALKTHPRGSGQCEVCDATPLIEVDCARALIFT